MGYDSHYSKDEVKFTPSKITNKKKCCIGIILITVIVIITVIVLAVVLSKSKDESGTDQMDNVVLLVSLDGFRHDYLSLGLTPNLNKIASLGVRAEYLRPIFPTNTFPNHYSIVTGLYPESHGIVTNTFFDSQLNDTFRIGGATSFEGKWWGGEPIWLTAMKQGLKAACFFWVGSEAPVQGIRPNYWRKFNSKVQFSTRINQVIAWLKMDSDKRPGVITLYFEQPDKKGHSTGPLSAEVKKTIKLVDDTVGELWSKLEENDFMKKVNVIIVSDHGMASINCKDIVNIDLLTDLSNMTVKGLGSSSMLYAKTQEDGEKVYRDLKCADNRLTALHKDIHTPRRMHYSNNRRIGDLFLTPDKGWQVLRNNTCRSWMKGYHGIDNIEKDMQAIFIASGPDFKSNYTFEHIQNIEIYNLLTDLLHIKPAPNNGTAGSLRHLLNPKFLKTLLPVASKRITEQNCGFPDDLEAALKECKTCVCPYCNFNISSNLTLFRKNLNLTQKEVIRSHNLHLPWALPEGHQVQCILTQKHYVTGYSTKLHIPLWVGYKLTKEQLLVNIPRKNCFRRDIRLTSAQSSFCKSYSLSGYDRGHIAPSGDFNFDEFAAQDTFMLSNIAPQHKYLNRYGAWSYLENLTRDLAKKYGNIYVLSGSIFDMNNDGLYDAELDQKRWLHNTTGDVPIPTHYYKILAKCNNASKPVTDCNKEIDTLAFIVPHNEEKMCSLWSVSEYTKKHVATIRDVELITGLTFFANLKASEQARLKVKLNTDIWLH
ncbi:ectonucleotide pyrophosphatase/phosphodiesterase family member 3-like [Hydractinia symbiolongicarpus]|uniref:ectonucleotide pyrophosphatase/phosphodiesterase family member 3-like n=1 Tax=Hydractinia symbiolongicarpus TaxID=13093 RepID=UPI00254AAE3A|nr:ectonucleotide pyrophosphatase/phosphodiesterase family member 3-like [Hydractinia symbiolongicarpus]